MPLIIIYDTRKNKAPDKFFPRKSRICQGLKIYFQMFMKKMEEFRFTADAKHEALGDQTIKVSHESSSIRQSVDYSDTWAEYGINLSYRPSDQSLVWLNVRRSSFADVEQDWKINLGARWLLD